ncbi:MAG: hypothetical protein M3328_12595, partial [Chloroflexota bacterium]|nr:hypothetical protein [Chloroflexota bacterium]
MFSSPLQWQGFPRTPARHPCSTLLSLPLLPTAHNPTTPPSAPSTATIDTQRPTTHDPGLN